MKNFTKTMFATLVCVTLVFTGCKKDDDGGMGSGLTEGNLTATVNGNNFQSLEGTTAAQETNSGGVRVIAVSAGTINSENLQMIVQNFDGVGTYPLNLLNIGTYSYLPDPSNPDPNSVVIYSTVNGTGNAGEINISSYSSTNVQGTFSFTGYNINDPNDTSTVSNGSFNIALTQN
tara:strand:+ start:101804 stop:102328 length:525 start_codon:yes stop_codon:yes gene_type:complete